MAPRKSLAGYLAAVLTGFCIGVGFWWGGSDWHREKHGAGNWAVLSTRTGVGMTGLVLGFVGATVEAWGEWLTESSRKCFLISRHIY
jgi:diacylglycerol kinase (CTP)